MEILTGPQIMEWEAYDRIDPIGTWRNDFNAANIAAAVTNVGIRRYGKKGAKLTTALDYMPVWYTEENAEDTKAQSVESMKTLLLGIASVQNKKVKKRRDGLKKH